MSQSGSQTASTVGVWLLDASRSGTATPEVEVVDGEDGGDGFGWGER